jgi:hypothetical protein
MLVEVLWLQAAVDNGGLIDFDGGENWLKRWTMFCVTIFVEDCDFRVIQSNASFNIQAKASFNK